MTSVLGFLFCKMLVIFLGRWPGPVSLFLLPCPSSSSFPHPAYTSPSSSHGLSPGTRSHPAHWLAEKGKKKKQHKTRFCRPGYIECSWSCFSPVGHVAWCFVAPCPQPSSTQGRFPCHSSRLGAGFPKQHLGTLTRQNQQHAQRNSSVPDS